MRVALIGLGGMGRLVARELQADSKADIELVGAIVAEADREVLQNETGLALPLLDNIDSLLNTKPDIIAECASHAAVHEHAERVLLEGISLLIISTGALADDGLLARLKQAATAHDAKILLPAGAVGGIDALGAARLAGLQRVTYRAVKPARAWQGTDAELSLDLESLDKTRCFYRGTAREAALKYPKNSNVAATVALAGMGFDNTTVELLADPEATENSHEIDVVAGSGSFRITLCGIPLPESPKTSALAAYSVARCLLDQEAVFVI